MRTLKRIFHYYFQNPITVPPFNKKAALIGGILLIIAGIRVYYNLYHYMDIVYGDEVVYMKTGLNLKQEVASRTSLNKTANVRNVVRVRGKLPRAPT